MAGSILSMSVKSTSNLVYQWLLTWHLSLWSRIHPFENAKVLQEICNSHNVNNRPIIDRYSINLWTAMASSLVSSQVFVSTCDKNMMSNVLFTKHKWPHVCPWQMQSMHIKWSLFWHAILFWYNQILIHS